jgi:heme-degrading monooxygenase HmoA
MKKLNKYILSTAFIISPVFAFAEVIEIATFNIKEGVSYQEFKPLDKAVEIQHVMKQPGFISRESAKGQNGEWLVVVHWESLKNADASMQSFMKAKAASKFMSHIDASTMSMKRYTK